MLQHNIPEDGYSGVMNTLLSYFNRDSLGRYKHVHSSYSCKQITIQVRITRAVGKTDTAVVPALLPSQPPSQLLSSPLLDTALTL
jgi:hypothetical protein